MDTYMFSDTHPFKGDRSHQVWDNLQALGWVADTSPVATLDQFKSVHDADYVHALEIASRPTLGSGADEKMLLFSAGIGGDTPAFQGMLQAALAVGGASLEAAKFVNDGVPLAINLSGGLHHARQERASGFCAVDDISLAINELRTKFERVAYIDIDLHHGDGVEARYMKDASVFTASIHQVGRFFYPGTGTQALPGAFNAPMSQNSTSTDWIKAVKEELIPAVQAFKPQAIVFQIGCDAHVLDPLGSLNVTSEDWYTAVTAVRDAFPLPTVLLGGGGYHPGNAARMWTAACLLMDDTTLQVKDVLEKYGDS